MPQDVRLTRWARAVLTRAALGLVGFLVLSGFSWFRHSLVNGYYLSKPDPSAVIMAHLVEAPRGHLNGAFVITTVNQRGSGPDIKRITVQGSIAEGNITLRTPGFFGHFRVMYIGTLAGDRLTLSRAGHSPITLYLSSDANYQHRLAVLTAFQSKISAYREGQSQILGYVDYMKKLKAAIPPYLAWGRVRIRHQVGVKAWWEKKVQYYDACLAKIRPLAAAGVREWRWSQCAMTVRNDAWARHQELALIRHSQQIDRVHADEINKMIREMPSEMLTASRTLRTMCPESNDLQKCRAEWKRLKALASTPNLASHSKRIRAFETLRPRVRQALQNDAAVASATNAHLQAVAAKIIAILNDPNRYGTT